VPIGLENIVQQKWHFQKNQLHVTAPNSAVSFAFVPVNVHECSLTVLGKRRHEPEGNFFVEQLARDRSVQSTSHCLHPLLDPSLSHSFATNRFIERDTHCHGCTHCKRQHAHVHPMQHVKKHLLVAVLMDDAWKGIEHQMDPSSFSSGSCISLLTTQPYAFSLSVTANMSAMSCSNFHNLSEHCFALFKRETA
jgi:hypothetical protein